MSSSIYCSSHLFSFFLFFFFNDPAPPEIYTLSLHDALPISLLHLYFAAIAMFGFATMVTVAAIQSIRGIVPARIPDRKSTRLNSSHVEISYAVFCLKKKKKKIKSAIKYKRAN